MTARKDSAALPEAAANPNPGRPGVRIPPPAIVWHVVGADGLIVATTTSEQRAEMWEDAIEWPDVVVRYVLTRSVERTEE